MTAQDNRKNFRYDLQMDPDYLRKRGVDPEEMLKEHRKHGKLGSVKRTGGSINVRGK